jgi:RimJ/RimL family protein N-acetyltransferase
MSGYPKNAQLKDGTTIILRPMERSDLQGLYDFFCSLPEEDKLYLKDDIRDRAVVERWVNNIDPEHVLAILATRGQEVVGDATLHVQKVGWSRHMGEIRCVVGKQHQSKGIGTLLARELVEDARQRGLQRITAQMMDCQPGATKAFERLGFKREAVLKGHVVDIHGKPHGLVVMVSEVEDVWRKLEDLIVDMDLAASRG